MWRQWGRPVGWRRSRRGQARRRGARVALPLARAIDDVVGPRSVRRRRTAFAARRSRRLDGRLPGRVARRARARTFRDIAARLSAGAKFGAIAQLCTSPGLRVLGAHRDRQSGRMTRRGRRGRKHRRICLCAGLWLVSMPTGSTPFSTRVEEPRFAMEPRARDRPGRFLVNAGELAIDEPSFCVWPRFERLAPAR